MNKFIQELKRTNSKINFSNYEIEMKGGKYRM